MIQIKLYQENWRMVIDDEVWEFETEEDLIKCQKEVMKLKMLFGKLKDRKGCY